MFLFFHACGGWSVQHVVGRVACAMWRQVACGMWCVFVWERSYNRCEGLGGMSVRGNGVIGVMGVNRCSIGCQ